MKLWCNVHAAPDLLDAAYAHVTSPKTSNSLDPLMCCNSQGMTLEDAVRKVLQTGGPVAHATRPDTVRLHDDKSTYTGVYAKGGPKAVDPPKNDLSSLLDRSQADVRGVKKVTPPK